MELENWVAGDQGRGSTKSVISGTIAVENSSSENVTYYLFENLKYGEQIRD